MSDAIRDYKENVRNGDRVIMTIWFIISALAKKGGAHKTDWSSR